MQVNLPQVSSHSSLADLSPRSERSTNHWPLSHLVGLEESLRLELNCDGFDGIHSTVVCPYYINTGMFAGIGRSLIPILTPEYVVNETVKAVLVNQEVLCLPTIVYFMIVLKSILPTKSFLWAHRAIGAASTMKTFTGRHGPNQQQLNVQQPVGQTVTSKGNDIMIKMTPPDIGINLPEGQAPASTRVQLNQ